MLTELLNQSVQHNCNIADAKHAASFTLCTYLMKMREFCRWDNGYALTHMLSKEEIGEWVSKREALWEDIEQQDYQTLNIDDQQYDPFQTEQINSKLLPLGLVYSGGLGNHCVPHFFLAKLEAQHDYADHKVIISSDEYARDLTAPPAMTLGDTIFIRKQSIRRMLWEKAQEWRWHKIENAMSKAFSYYPFDDDIDAALDAMTSVELKSILLHEKGEIETSHRLGDEWKMLLTEVTDARVELMLRTIKDLYADTSVTLPALIESNNIASLHFFAGNMTALRKDLCPSFVTTYKAWCEGASLEYFSAWVLRSQQHWQQLTQALLAMQTSAPEALTKAIEGARF